MSSEHWTNWRYKLAQGAKKRIQENSLKKFTPEERERLKELADKIAKELAV